MIFSYNSFIALFYTYLAYCNFLYEAPGGLIYFKHI